LSPCRAGQQISVQIDELNVEGKKLVLSMKSESRADVSAFENVPHDRWFQGVITSVSNFGLFVRPAGYDCTGK
jgi:ribosomal protein S1